MALGLAQQIGLSWLLQDGYGALRGALSPASITYNPLISAGVQGMSWSVSRAHPGQQRRAIVSGLLLHAGLALLTAAGFFALAPLLGAWLGSEYLVPAFRVLSLVVLFYGLYAPLVGILNGQRRFLAQAVLDMLAATLRTIALFAGAWWLLKQGAAQAVVGASWAFALVIVVMIALTAALVWRSATEPAASHDSHPARMRQHLGFIVPVLGSQIALNLLLQADTNTLRGFATRAALQAGLEPNQADALVGAYNAGQLFGFLPYQLLVGITFILFPMLAKAHVSEDQQAVARYVRTGVRIALLLTGVVVSVSSGISRSLLRLVFPPQFAELGTEAMQLLTLGLSAFALFGVFATVLNSLGKQWLSLLITVSALGAVFGLNWLLVSGVEFGPALLNRTALATSVGVCLAALLSGLAVRHYARSLASPVTWLRVAGATAVCIFAGRLLPELTRPLTVLVALAVSGLYLTLLIATGELSKQDLARAKALLPTK